MIGLRLDGYDPDLHHDAAVAFCIRARDDELFSPRHQHRKGQLILALHGAITCEVENAMWMVPHSMPSGSLARCRTVIM